MSKSLLINLSFLIPEPTGISIYASHILPALKPLQPTLLTAQENPDYSCYSVPNNMTPDQGTKGHLRRLLWTHFYEHHDDQYRENNCRLVGLKIGIVEGCRRGELV